MTNILARIKSLGYAAAVTSGINKLNVLMHGNLPPQIKGCTAMAVLCLILSAVTT